MFPTTITLGVFVVLLSTAQVQSLDGFLRVNKCIDDPEKLPKVEQDHVQLLNTPGKTWSVKYTAFNPTERYNGMILAWMTYNVVDDDGKVKVKIPFQMSGGKYRQQDPHEETIIELRKNEIDTDVNGDGKADMKYYILKANEEKYFYVYKCSIKDVKDTNVKEDFHARYVLYNPEIEQDIEKIKKEMKDFDDTLRVIFKEEICFVL